MKTIKSIKEEIVEVKYRIENEEMKSAAVKRLKNRIAFLKLCIAYIETNPAKEFILSELKKVDEKIDKRMNLFVLSGEENMTKKDVSKLRKAHEKLYEVKRLRDQLRALKFLAA